MILKLELCVLGQGYVEVTMSNKIYTVQGRGNGSKLTVQEGKKVFSL